MDQDGTHHGRMGQVAAAPTSAVVQISHKPHMLGFSELSAKELAMQRPTQQQNRGKDIPSYLSFLASWDSTVDTVDTVPAGPQ